MKTPIEIKHERRDNVIYVNVFYPSFNIPTLLRWIFTKRVRLDRVDTYPIILEKALQDNKEQ